jgi:hypothetical protein
MRELINLLKEAPTATAKTPVKPAVKPTVKAKPAPVKDPGLNRMNKQLVQQLLTQAGYEQIKVNGNRVHAIVQIPAGQAKTKYRQLVLNNILQVFQKKLPDAKPRIIIIPEISSAGVIVFDGTPVNISVKDEGKQADKSAGVGNELELASMMQSMIQKYGSINATFIDRRGKSISIQGATKVDASGRNPGRQSTGGIKKADVVLSSVKQQLPISIKELSAASWESAEGSFGAKARGIIDNLIKQGAIRLDKLQDDLGRDYYQLNKEIVVEPTEEESIKAIFGTDINPEGGIVIQDFKPHHFKQEGNNVTIECYTVIKTKADIPESHLMVWRIGNSKTRPGKAIGYRGLRPQALTLVRALGTRGTKDVVLVDKDGNVLRGGLNQPHAEPTEPSKPTTPRVRRASTSETPRQRR